MRDHEPTQIQRAIYLLGPTICGSLLRLPPPSPRVRLLPVPEADVSRTRQSKSDWSLFIRVAYVRARARVYPVGRFGPRQGTMRGTQM